MSKSGTWTDAAEEYDAEYPASEAIELDYDIDDQLVEEHLEQSCHQTDREYDGVEVIVVEPEENLNKKINTDAPKVWGVRRPVYIKVQFWQSQDAGKSGEKTVHAFAFVDGHESLRVTGGVDSVETRRPLNQDGEHLTPNREETTRLVVDAAVQAGYEYVPHE